MIEPAVAAPAELAIAPAMAPSLWDRIGAQMDGADALLSVALTLVVYGLSGSAPAALVVGGVDLILRPIVAMLRAESRARRPAAPDENNESGAGI